MKIVYLLVVTLLSNSLVRTVNIVNSSFLSQNMILVMCCIIMFVDVR